MGPVSRQESAIVSQIGSSLALQGLHAGGCRLYCTLSRLRISSPPCIVYTVRVNTPYLPFRDTCVSVSVAHVSHCTFTQRRTFTYAYVRTYVRYVQDVIYPLQVCACRYIAGVSLWAAVRVRRGTRSRMGLKVVGILLEGEKYEPATNLFQRLACAHRSSRAHG